MKLLITGGTGLLGSHIIQQALKLDFEIIILTRGIPTRSYLNQVKNKIEIQVCDITKPESINPEFFNNVSTIIHCAGLASTKDEDADNMYQINVNGTKNLYNIAKASNVKRWIQISSIATLSGGSGETIDESTQNEFRKTSYTKSKKEADDWLKKQNELALSIIYPCYMLGKFDSRPSSGSIFLAMKFGKLKQYLNNTKNFVAASDVALGILQLITKNINDNLILGNVNSSIKEFLEISFSKLGLDNQLLTSIRENDLKNLDETEQTIINEFCLSSPIDSGKAQKIINYRPRVGLEDMINESIDYLVDKRLLRIRRSS
jgi:dihydroflavonol-4-reductase